MVLYHYSNINIKDKLKIKYYGANYFTSNDVKATYIKRLFCYTVPKAENLLKNSKYLYVIDIKEKYIYDLNKDIYNYKNKYKTISDILKAIKNKGYKGIKYNINYDIVNLFNDVKFKEKIPLTI